MLSVIASCGSSWAIWAGGVLVTLGVCRHLDALVICGSSSGEGDCDCEGSCVFPLWSAKDNSSGLCVACGFVWHPIAGLACDAN